VRPDGRDPSSGQLFGMNTCQRKRLRLHELALLPGSGSRKAAGAVLWFSETTRIAFEGLASTLSQNAAHFKKESNSGLLIGSFM
jgi:hypothetical protein